MGSGLVSARRPSARSTSVHSAATAHHTGQVHWDTCSRGTLVKGPMSVICVVGSFFKDRLWTITWPLIILCLSLVIIDEKLAFLWWKGKVGFGRVMASSSLKLHFMECHYRPIIVTVEYLFDCSAPKEINFPFQLLIYLPFCQHHVSSEELSGNMPIIATGYFSTLPKSCHLLSFEFFFLTLLVHK